MTQRWHPITATAALCVALVGITAAPARAQIGIPGAGSLPAPPPLPAIDLDPRLLDAIANGGTSPIEAVVTFNHPPTMADLAALSATGVRLARFDVLPMAGVRGTATQISGLFGLAGLRSIYLNRRIAYFLNQSVPLIGADRAWSELGVSGAGVAVAILDTGIDGTHADLPFGTKILQNVKIVRDLFGTGPLVLEGLADTDTSSGHGTHVASTAAGTGAALGGKYRGVAIGAKLVGVGAGDALFVLAALEGFDWILAHQAKYGIRVISNSWGTTGPFDPDDPINVASRAAHDAGMVVVFAAGNAGPGADTLNPYCVAPWAICVAAGLKDGRTLADFSSRGIPGDPLYHPTLTAPGVGIAAARASTGLVLNAFLAADLLDLGTDALYYLRASGTSMATPHVSGTAALVLQADPALTPDQVKSVLQETATPLPLYAQHEAGAGYLNAYEAVRKAIALRVASTPPDAIVRHEETDPAIAYSGTWTPFTDARCTADQCTISAQPGARATFGFSGTGVTWITFRSTGRTGIANVYVDGAFAAQIDTHSDTPDPQAAGFTRTGMPRGAHTIAIEVTGTKNAAASEANIAVDAFDVTP